MLRWYTFCLAGCYNWYTFSLALATSLLLSIILIFSLVACSSPKENEVSSNGSNSKDAEEPIVKEEDNLLDDDDVIEIKDKELERLIKDVLDIETDEILVEYLKDLEELEFNGDDYDVEDLEGLEHAENLRIIRGTDVNIKSLKPIAKLKKLEDIMFWDSTIGEFPDKLETPSLLDVEISNSNITDASFLAGTPAKYVTLRENKISSIDFAKTMKNLRSLDLFDNNVSDLSPIEDMETIDFINFENNKLTDISVISTLTGLTSAILSDNSDLVDLDALKDHPTLEVLTFYGFKGDMTVLEDLINRGITVRYEY